jgi:hypothetical protein
MSLRRDRINCVVVNIVALREVNVAREGRALR